MAYTKLNLTDNVDKWKASDVAHMEDGIVANENNIQKIIDYGYSGAVTTLGNLSDEDAITTAIESIYSSMSNSETRVIRWTGYPSASDYSFFGILTKSSANYGSLQVQSAYCRGTLISKAKYGGVWQPLEWVNPPMYSGIEYRTTRRHLGNPVYCKVIEHTNTEAFGNDTGAKAYNIAHGISNLGLPVEIRGFYNNNYTLPYRKQAGGTLFIGQISASYIVMQSYAYTVAAGATWRFEIYYTKTI